MGNEPGGRRAIDRPERMLICMQSTSVRIDVATHEELKQLAAELHTTVGNTVTLAVRALRQDRIGSQLRDPLRDDETGWLGADGG
jgi:predicted transcriptional regulator